MLKYINFGFINALINKKQIKINNYKLLVTMINKDDLRIGDFIYHLHIHTSKCFTIEYCEIIGNHNHYNDVILKIHSVNIYIKTGNLYNIIYSQYGIKDRECRVYSLNGRYKYFFRKLNSIKDFVEGDLQEESSEEIQKNDDTSMVEHPKHYTSHPSGIECIIITRHYCFSIGNAIKYLWRAGLKKEQGLDDRTKEIEDLEKAIWYIKDRIKELKSNK